MRELKFRAWDKKASKYDTENWVMYPDGKIELPESGWDLHGSDDSDLFIIEQFTGLHDKNGKEIYEGDIVDIELHDGTQNRMIVKWDKTGFMLFDITGTGFWRVSHTPIEIAGNIHEPQSEKQEGEI